MMILIKYCLSYSGLCRGISFTAHNFPSGAYYRVDNSLTEEFIWVTFGGIEENVEVTRTTYTGAPTYIDLKYGRKAALPLRFRCLINVTSLCEL